MYLLNTILDTNNFLKINTWHLMEEVPWWIRCNAVSYSAWPPILATQLFLQLPHRCLWRSLYYCSQMTLMLTILASGPGSSPGAGHGATAGRLSPPIGQSPPHCRPIGCPVPQTVLRTGHQSLGSRTTLFCSALQGCPKKRYRRDLMHLLGVNHRSLEREI